MRKQLFLPGLAPNSAIDVLFFALLVGPENAPQIVRLRERLCRESGVRGRPVAADLLHISLHGVGAYDGLHRAVVERATKAAASIKPQPFDVVLDRAMSFKGNGDGRPLVLRTADEAALVTLHRLLGGAMRNAGFRRVPPRFTPHVTLLYGDRVLPERAIEAVRWTVRDFVLVQSLRGRGQPRYIHLARWPLRG
jgi:2'-5' RNA ligase